MRFDLKTRRNFLTGAGGAVLALPFLPSALPRGLWRSAEAAPPSVPRRFLAIKTYNGTPLLAFYPGEQPGYETHAGDGRTRLVRPLSESSGRHQNGQEYFGHWAPLSDFSGNGISTIFNTDFNRHHENMLLLRGMDLMPNLNHNHGAMLGNFGLRTRGVGGALPGAQINVTIDQVMAVSPNVYPTPPLGPRILHVGSRTNTFSYAPNNPNELLATGEGAVQQVQALTDPRTAFQAALGMVQSGDAPAAPLSVGARLVDRVLEDYQRVTSRPHLSAADRQLLDQHMTRLTELESRLGVQAVSGCQVPEAPASLDTGGEFNADVTEISTFFDQMADIIVLAFACDVTRIATLDVTKMVIRDGGGFGMGDSENANSAGRENWHFQAHKWDDQAIRWLTLGAEWVAQEVILRVLDALDATPERDGESLLHHSMVVWSNELSFNHLSYSLPTAVWGRAGGYLETGRYIDYIDHNQPVRFRQHGGPVIEGVQFNRFIATMAQAMAVEPAEYERTTGGGFGESNTIGKNNDWAIDYDQSRVGDVLPGIRA
ncbi:MAG: DUF1552 domain-containing protein [Myxococcota bacterium]